MTTLASESPPYAGLEIGRYPLPFGFEATGEFMREVQELNPGKLIECWKNRELVVTVGAGGNASARGGSLYIQVDEWTVKLVPGLAEESSQGYDLPDGTQYKPDVSWMDEATVRLLNEMYETDLDWPEYLPVAPRFVAEIASPSDKRRDNLAQQRAKCGHWVEQGVGVAWLIDPFDDLLLVYRDGIETEIHQRPARIEVGPEMPGLEIDFGRIWTARGSRG